MPKVTLRVKRASKETPRIKPKISKSFSKRFSVSGSGLIMSTQAGKRHNMSQKSKRKLLQSKGKVSANKSLFKLVRNALNLKLPKSASRVYEVSSSQVTHVILPKAFKKLIPIV